MDARDDRRLGRSAADTKPPRPKRCSLYRSVYGLPMPLKPSGQTPTISPARQQPLGVGVARQRVPGPARQLPDEAAARRPGRHPACAAAMLRVMVVQRDLGHHRVERDRARVVRRRSARRLRRACSRARAPRSRNHCSYSGRSNGISTSSVSSAVEAEVVDLVLALEPTTQELQRSRQLPLPSGSAGSISACSSDDGHPRVPRLSSGVVDGRCRSSVAGDSGLGVTPARSPPSAE